MKCRVTQSGKTHGTQLVRSFIENSIGETVSKAALSAVRQIAKAKASELKKSILPRLVQAGKISGNDAESIDTEEVDTTQNISDSKIKAYINTIGVSESKQAKTHIFMVGVSGTSRYLDGTSYSQVGRTLEYGTSATPAIPHFSPVLENMKSNLPKYYKFINGRINNSISQGFNSLTSALAREKQRKQFST